MTERDPREELATLAAALRVHAQRCMATGASGLESGSVAPRAAPGASAAPEAAATSGTPSPPVAAPRLHDAAPGRTGAGPTPEATARLAVLAGEISNCRKCRLCEDRKQTVFSRGTGASGLCFVGEGPGADEDEQGAPFVGKAGQLLDKMIEAMGFGRDDVYVCNIVKCRPPKNRKPEPAEMAACAPYLAEQIALVDPKVIVALGATAVEGLLGISGGITRLRGSWRLYGGRVAVMPTFHPAYLLRAPEAKRDVWNDLQEVVKHLGQSLPTKK